MLERSAKGAVDNNACLVICPEGTRSTTGQLLPFKKGTFHVWEQQQSAIIPMIVFGGYEIFPVGTWLNVPGKVIVQFLPMIKPEDADTRDQVSGLVYR